MLEKIQINKTILLSATKNQLLISIYMLGAYDEDFRVVLSSFSFTLSNNKKIV